MTEGFQCKRRRDFEAKWHLLELSMPQLDDRAVVVRVPEEAYVEASADPVIELAHVLCGGDGGHHAITAASP